MIASERIRVEFIETLPGRRPVNEEAVLRMMESIKRIGLRTPLSVRLVDGFKVDGDEVDGQPVLVTGAHRLEAVRRLGWEHVECFVMTDGDEANARRWEISENLHRADLTAMERSELVAEWTRLVEEDQKVAQVAPLKEPGKGRGSKGGIRAASLAEVECERARRRQIELGRTHGVPPLEPIGSKGGGTGRTAEAKATAIEVGLDDNRTALLQAARADTEQQVEVLREYAIKKQAPAPTPMPKSASVVDLVPTPTSGNLLIGKLADVPALLVIESRAHLGYWHIVDMRDGTVTQRPVRGDFVPNALNLSYPLAVELTWDRYRPDDGDPLPWEPAP